MKNALPIGTVLKGQSFDYTILRVLGQGSFGITYLATTKMRGALGELNVQVAVKEFFARELCSRGSDCTMVENSTGSLAHKYSENFKKEAVRLASIKHKGIIQVLEFFEANNTCYYSMEYIDGGTLDDYVSSKGSLSEDEALPLCRDLAEALSFMHGHHMLHLDLKPKNIMRRVTGELVLIDFGLSKQYAASGEPESSTSIGLGTPGFAPIEQMMHCGGDSFAPSLDVYALGGTLFKMLTGHTPPDASTIFNTGFPDSELQRCGISSPTIELLCQAMAPRLADRIHDMPTFISRLDDIPVRPSENTIIPIVLNDETLPLTDVNDSVVGGTWAYLDILDDTSQVDIVSMLSCGSIASGYACRVTRHSFCANIAQSSAHCTYPFTEQQFSQFLHNLASLHLAIRPEKAGNPETELYMPFFGLKLYDAQGRVYQNVWIYPIEDGGNLVLPQRPFDFDGKIYAFLPQLKDYLQGPYAEIPWCWVPSFTGGKELVGPGEKGIKALHNRQIYCFCDQPVSEKYADFLEEQLKDQAVPPLPKVKKWKALISRVKRWQIVALTALLVLLIVVLIVGRHYIPYLSFRENFFLLFGN